MQSRLETRWWTLCWLAAGIVAPTVSYYVIEREEARTLTVVHMTYGVPDDFREYKAFEAMWSCDAVPLELRARVPADAPLWILGAPGDDAVDCALHAGAACVDRAW